MASHLPLSCLVLLETVLLNQFLPALSIPASFALWVFVSFSTWITWTIFIKPFWAFPLQHLSEPKGAHYLLGHMLKVNQSPPGTEFHRWAKELPHDEVIRFRSLFNRTRLLVTGPNAIADVLSRHLYDFEKPEAPREIIRRVAGNGLFVAEGNEHKLQRKNMQPSFAFSHIKALYPLFWSRSLVLTQHLSAKLDETSNVAGHGTDSQIIEIDSWSSRVSLDIIGIAALGCDFDSMKDTDHPLIALYKEALSPTTEMKLFFLASVTGFAAVAKRVFWRVDRRLARTTKKLREICHNIMLDHKRKIDLETDGPSDILSEMLKTGNFGDEGMIDQMLTLLVAGHETTSSTFTWACYLLAVHQDIQASLRDEARTALSDFTRDTGNSTSGSPCETLESMPYLNAICNEVLRLYPAVPVTTRVAVRPTEVGGHHIPKGTIIVVSPWATNRSAQLWGPDSEDFKPSRWIDKDGRLNRHGGVSNNFCHLTFLQGNRNCIGQKFAMAELRALLGAFAATFKWSLAMAEEDVVPAGVITIKPKNGLFLKLERI